MSEARSIPVLTNPRRWMILFLVTTVTFMAALDSSIVNVALPTMSAKLGVNSGMIAWIVAVYLIVISATILIFGRLGDIFGQSRIFQTGIILFTIGSALCGISHSLPLLMIGRIVQAIGAAATMGNNQGIITKAFPAAERGRALGFSGTAVALGSLVGPALGGVIVSFIDWEYIFWINIPIGLFTFALSFKYLPKRANRIKETMDLPGAALFILFIAPLFYAFNQSHAWGFSDPRILISLAVSALSFLFFLVVEKRSSMPLLDLSIFKNMWFTVSIICGFLNYVALFTTNIVHPLYLQYIRDLSPAMAGLVMTITPLIMVIAAPAGGYLSDKIGPEIVTLIGLIVTAAGLLLMSTFNTNTSIAVLILFVGLVALGNANFQAPNTALVMSSVTRDKFGIGGSVNGLARNLGMITGITLSTTLLYSGMSRKMDQHVTGYVEGQKDAFLYGMRTVYLVAAGICLLCVLITALRLKKRKERTVL